MLGKVESRETSKMFLDDVRERRIQVYQHLSHPSGRSGICQASGEYMGQEPAQKRDSCAFVHEVTALTRNRSDTTFSILLRGLVILVARVRGTRFKS